MIAYLVKQVFSSTQRITRMRPLFYIPNNIEQENIRVGLGKREETGSGTLFFTLVEKMIKKFGLEATIRATEIKGSGDKGVRSLF